MVLDINNVPYPPPFDLFDVHVPDRNSFFSKHVNFQPQELAITMI